MAGWLELSRGVVHPWHHDHYGHMNVRHYAPFFDDASYHLWTLVGVPLAPMLSQHGVHTVAARATTEFRRELRAGDLFVVEGAVLRVGSKSVTLKLRMRHSDTGEIHATYDTVEVFFDPATRRSTEIPPAMRRLLEAHLLPEDVA